MPARPRSLGGSGEFPSSTIPQHPVRTFSKVWIWGLAVVAIIVVGALALFAFRKTTITVIPRSHQIVFDDTAVFTAYPAATAATGTIVYTVRTIDAEDSALVTAQGTQHAERKASGTITVVNEYSAAPVKLVKQTRFQTPDGFVFRTPADIMIPGKKGSTAGTVQVTVIADQAGQNYNVGPVSRFTLPGLKGGAMYSSVYARSAAAMSGGFIGDEPATQPGAVQQATADMRTRLEQKVRADIQALPSDLTAFPDLAVITYEDLAPTSENNGVRLHEKIHAQVPVFPNALFASAVAQTISTDVQNAQVSLVPGPGYAGKRAGDVSQPLGDTALSFTLAGQAQLVWVVNTEQLAKDLAGHDQGAFQTIVSSNPAIREARARIEPFWTSSFPKDAAAIRIVIEQPEPKQPVNP